MSKQKEFQIEDFGHVTDPMLLRIQGVIADRKRQTLSSGAIYKAYNELFKLRDPQQTCVSCLITRSDKIIKWYEWYASQAAPAPQSIQLPVQNVGTGGDNPVQATHDLEGGGVMTVHSDGSVKVDGMDAEPNCVHFLANGGSLVTSADMTLEPEAVNYVGLLAKYRLTESLTTEGERDALMYTIAESSARFTPFELSLLNARLAELNTPVAAQVLLQKIDKDDYSKTDGDSFIAAFTPNADDASKGTVINTVTGKAVVAGTYATEDTTKVLTVAIGGKASYKAV